MKIVNENGSLISEFQNINELNAEDLELIAGGYGWHDFTEGLRDVLAGTGDGFTGNERQEDNFPYLSGYLIGGGISALVPG